MIKNSILFIKSFFNCLKYLSQDVMILNCTSYLYGEVLPEIYNLMNVVKIHSAGLENRCFNEISVHQITWVDFSLQYGYFLPDYHKNTGGSDWDQYHWFQCWKFHCIYIWTTDFNDSCQLHGDPGWSIFDKFFTTNIQLYRNDLLDIRIGSFKSSSCPSVCLSVTKVIIFPLRIS